MGTLRIDFPNGSVIGEAVKRVFAREAARGSGSGYEYEGRRGPDDLRMPVAGPTGGLPRRQTPRACPRFNTSSTAAKSCTIVKGFSMARLAPIAMASSRGENAPVRITAEMAMIGMVASSSRSSG